MDKVSEYKLQNNFDVILNDTDSDIVEYRFSLGKNIWTPKKRLWQMSCLKCFNMAEHKNVT